MLCGWFLQGYCCKILAMFIIQDSYIYRFVSKFSPGSLIRLIGKRIFKGCTIKQSFHNGVICLDAVEHSWAWLGHSRYETFDRELQEKLLSLSKKYEIMIDIGCNIGAMALYVVLKNPNIKAICIDPNSRAINLLNESMRINRLTHRVNTIKAAVSDKEGIINFDKVGSVMGHIDRLASPVKSISFTRLINDYSFSARCLVKIDVEGFETVLMRQLSGLHNLNKLCLVVELHPLKFNDFGNPKECLNLLLTTGAIVQDLKGQPISQVEENKITQIIARWAYA